VHLLLLEVLQVQQLLRLMLLLHLLRLLFQHQVLLHRQLPLQPVHQVLLLLMYQLLGKLVRVWSVTWAALQLQIQHQQHISTLQPLRLRRRLLLLLLQQAQQALQLALLLLQQVKLLLQHQQHRQQHLLPLLLHPLHPLLLVQLLQQVLFPPSPQVSVGISYQTMEQPLHGLTYLIGEQSNVICISTP